MSALGRQICVRLAPIKEIRSSACALEDKSGGAKIRLRPVLTALVASVGFVRMHCCQWKFGSWGPPQCTPGQKFSWTVNWEQFS
jgi:hypothetical protein